ncbi:MAG: type IV secretion system DNA-binding domain-containing protein, partial [Rhodospirillaceae bacterium]|nr:type IV secretion system DNA-binding domain-containing protein [Rhodospirillaceae bacterium]
HQVPSLQPGLAESRQFGGCFVLGVQVASALRDLYGRNGAETISGLCGTRVVLAAPDRDTAQWSADSLGRSEVEEVTEGYSYGANTIRDGVSLTPRREIRALALPSEIMRLPNLEGYLKFPGPFPVASIRLTYTARPKAAERFVPRKEDDAAANGTADATEMPASGASVKDEATMPEPAVPAGAGTGGDRRMTRPAEADRDEADGAEAEGAETARAPEADSGAPEGDGASPAAARPGAGPVAPESARGRLIRT